jgi:hypothetical protein
VRSAIGAAADAVASQMNVLGERLRKAEAARDVLRQRLGERLRAQQRVVHAVDHCRRVAGKLEAATYGNKRLALEALDATDRRQPSGAPPAYRRCVGVSPLSARALPDEG